MKLLRQVKYNSVSFFFKMISGKKVSFFLKKNVDKYAENNRVRNL